MVSKLFQFVVHLHVTRHHKSFYYFTPSFEIETLLLVQYVAQYGPESDETSLRTNCEKNLQLVNDFAK